MSTRRRAPSGWLLSVAVWAGIAALLGYVAFALGFYGTEHLGTMVLALLLTSVIAVAAHAVSSDADRRWLPTVVIVTFGLKLLASGLRYWILVAVYDASGDAGLYHTRGLELADIWRTFTVPDVTYGGAGTTFVSKATGFIYTAHEPTILGGFFIFATLAFVGQLLLYVAFRRAVPTSRLFWYGIAIFALPSLLFWPSSIGKESLMLLFIGITAYGAARLLTEYRVQWGLIASVGVLGAAAIRPHVAGLLVGAVGIALLFGKPPYVPGRNTKRLVLIGAGLAALLVLVARAGDQLGVAIGSSADLDPIFDELERHTQQGGSAVDDQVVTSVSALPGAVLRVLFRPLPHEAHNLQALLSAAEGTFLLALTAWRLPKIVRNFRYIRSYPYLIMSLVFTVAFVFVFSSIFNLGILARQRSQVLPFLMAVVVGLGWDLDAPRHPPDDSKPARLSKIGANP